MISCEPAALQCRAAFLGTCQLDYSTSGGRTIREGFVAQLGMELGVIDGVAPDFRSPPVALLALGCLQRVLVLVPSRPRALACPCRLSAISCSEAQHAVICSTAAAIKPHQHAGSLWIIALQASYLNPSRQLHLTVFRPHVLTIAMGLL